VRWRNEDERAQALRDKGAEVVVGITIEPIVTSYIVVESKPSST